MSNRTSEKVSKCWLCEKEFSGAGYPTIFGMECSECGPPQPLGPTPEEPRDLENA